MIACVGVCSGVSATTLESVFMSVLERAHQHDDNDVDDKNKKTHSITPSGRTPSAAVDDDKLLDDTDLLVGQSKVDGDDVPMRSNTGRRNQTQSQNTASIFSVPNVTSSAAPPSRGM